MSKRLSHRYESCSPNLARPVGEFRRDSRNPYPGKRQPDSFPVSACRWDHNFGARIGRSIFPGTHRTLSLKADLPATKNNTDTHPLLRTVTESAERCQN